MIGFFKWRKIVICIQKIYINAGHILGDGPFFLSYSITLCADPSFETSSFIRKTEKNIIMFKILTCIKKLLFLLCFSYNPELYKGCNTITLLKEKAVVRENNTEQKSLCFPVDRAFLIEDGRSYHRPWILSEGDKPAGLSSRTEEENPLTVWAPSWNCLPLHRLAVTLLTPHRHWNTQERKCFGEAETEAQVVPLVINFSLFVWALSRL